MIFDDVHFASHTYDSRLAHAQSKTANVLFAVEVARRWAGDGITANEVATRTLVAAPCSADLYW